MVVWCCFSATRGFHRPILRFTGDLEANKTMLCNNQVQHFPQVWVAVTCAFHEQQESHAQL